MNHFHRDQNNYDTDAASLASGLECTDVSKTIQSQRDEADINTIVKRFGLDKMAHFGSIPLPPSIDEFCDVFDFQTAMNIQARAQQSFNMLHPDIRAKYGNDPHQFVGDIDSALNETDPKRRERRMEDLREMGLAVPAPSAPTPEPAGTGAVNGTPPATPVAGGSPQT